MFCIVDKDMASGIMGNVSTRQKVRQQTFTLILSPYKKQVEEKFKLKTASAKLTE